MNLQSFTKKRIAIALTIVILTQGAWACNEAKAKQFAKATDDIAQGQLAIANTLKDSQTSGLLTPEDTKVLKDILTEINAANAEAIEISRSITTDEIPMDKQTLLLQVSKKFTDSIVKLNNEGSLRIKDPAKRLAFSGLVMSLQAAASSIIVLVVKKG